MEFFIRNYQFLVPYILRLLLGIVFILHGTQKLFGWFGGSGLEGFVAWMGTFGVPVWLAYVAVACECLGGLSVLLGIVPELGALMIMGTMIGAIVLVHWPHGFFIQNNGYEYTLTLVLLCVALIASGPGNWCLWDPLAAWRI